MGDTDNNLYAELEVSSSASAEELKRAYRSLAHRFHPDLHPGDPECARRFARVNEAYSWLSDPAKRALYDEFGDDCRVWGFDPELARIQRRMQSPSHFGDLFTGLYGSSNGTQPHASQQTSRSRRSVSPDRFADLLDSVGTSAGTTAWQPSAEEEDWTPPPPYGQEPAAEVHAEVWLDFRSAMRGGRGQLTLPSVGGGPRAGETIALDIPAGVEHGEKLRVPGLGYPSSDGRDVGDLVVTAFVSRDEHLTRNGRDLHTKVRLSESEALAGASVVVSTLDGDVRVRVPPRPKPGQKLRLRGKGVPSRDGAPAGDLYVSVLIELPPPSGVRRRGEASFTWKPK